MVGVYYLLILSALTGPLAPAGALPSRTVSQLWPSLEVMEEVLGPDGPVAGLAGQAVVLYVDQDSGLGDALLALPAYKATPGVVVKLGSGPQGAQWVQGQPAAVLGGRHLVHVVVFEHDPRPFLREAAQDQRWNPKYLLLVSLGQQNASHILADDVLTRVQRCVLLQTHRERLRGAVEALVYFPFSPTHKVQSLGLWRPRKSQIRPGLDVLINTEDQASLAQEKAKKTWMGGELFVDRFPSFEGYKFLLGTWFDDYPYLHQSLTGPEGEGDGVMVEMLNAMASVLNFTYHLTTEPPDLQWGNFENGSWTGMLGMLHRKDKNFTVNYFGLTHERIRDFDASVSYWMEGFGLALLTPLPLPKWRSVFYPFMPMVWGSVAVAFVFAVLIMMLQGCLMNGRVGVGGSVGVGETWEYLVRPVLSHSLPRLPGPKVQWQRVFLATWILACLILTTAYTANLIAFLTIPVYPQRIQTVQQLANSHFRVAMYDYGEFVPDALKSSKDQYYRTLGERLDLYPSTESSVYSLTNGTHAYIESYSYAVVLLNVVHKAYNTYMLRDQLYPNHLCWYFQKNTAWKYKFDNCIQRLVEAGFIPRWLKIKTADFLGLNYDLKQRVASKERQPITALSLEHMEGVFFLGLLGLGVGLLVLITELIVHCRYHSPNPQE